jgi:hypothetical protein
MKRIAISVLSAFVAVAPTITLAAKAPLSPEELKKEATHIVTGKVVEVTSKTQKSKVEKAWGIHRDRVFTITVRLSDVVKGADVQKGEQMEVEAWQPSKRIPPLSGLQGHGAIPKRGDTVALYLKGKNGNAFKPLLPNGIVIQEKRE